MIRAVIRSMAAAILAFAGYILMSRGLGFAAGWLDWCVLVLAALLPLSSARVRSQPWLAVGVVLVSGAVMFFVSFALIALFFGDSL